MNRREFMGTGVALLAPRLTAAGDGEIQVPPAKLPGLRYHPEGDAIVVHNGGQSYNRPLYCHRIWPVVYAGDKPQLLGLDWAGGFGRLSIGLIRQGKGSGCTTSRTSQRVTGRGGWSGCCGTSDWQGSH